MRLVFIGSGEIGLPSLQALLADGDHEVLAVITQPDKPSGRNLQLRAGPIKLCAQQAGVLVWQPQRIAHCLEELRALQADVAVVVAYGQILPLSVLEAPRLGCLNIHASLLPRHRGASPIHAAIAQGDAQSGITIMFVDVGLDSGDILLQEALPILPTDTGGSLHDKLAQQAPGVLQRALALLAKPNCPRQVQDPSMVTHCGKLRREDGRLDFNNSALQLERLVRAFNPWPGTHLLLPNAAVLKVHAAQIEPSGDETQPGRVRCANPKEGLVIECAQGALRLTELQAEGGKRLSAADYLRGHPSFPETLL